MIKYNDFLHSFLENIFKLIYSFIRSRVPKVGHLANLINPNLSFMVIQILRPHLSSTGWRSWRGSNILFHEIYWRLGELLLSARNCISHVWWKQWQKGNVQHPECDSHMPEPILCKMSRKSNPFTWKQNATIQKYRNV